MRKQLCFNVFFGKSVLQANKQTQKGIMKRDTLWNVEGYK